MNAVIRSKGINLSELLRVVDEVLHALTIFSSKVLCHTLKTLEHAFADGNTWHYNHKFRPAIAGVQLIHGLDVGIGLTRTCFHLNGKGTSVSLQMLHGIQSFCHLYATHILANALIAETVEVERTKLVQESAAAIVFGLPLKHIAHAFGGFRLKALMFISYFHFLPPFLLLSLIALIAFK